MHNIDDDMPFPQILILGADGQAGSPGSDGLAGVNSKGKDTGQNGKDGSSGIFSCDCATDGTAGADAVSGGGPGTAGGNGAAADRFVLTATHYVGAIYILSCGGTGGTMPGLKTMVFW